MVTLEELRQVIAEGLATTDPHTIMIEIIKHFTEVGVTPEGIVEQLKLLGYIMC